MHQLAAGVPPVEELPISLAGLGEASYPLIGGGDFSRLRRRIRCVTEFWFWRSRQWRWPRAAGIPGAPADRFSIRSAPRTVRSFMSSMRMPAVISMGLRPAGKTVPGTSSVPVLPVANSPLFGHLNDIRGRGLSSAFPPFRWPTKETGFRAAAPKGPWRTADKSR